MSPASRHPLLTAIALGVAGAVVAILVLVLVVVPLLDAAAQVPGQLAHAYSDYWNSVGQQFQQARQHGGAP